IGAGGAYYNYEEESLGVEETGAMFTGNVAGTLTFNQSWFATLEGRYGYSSVDYSSSSGKASGDPTQLWEFRGLIGRDFEGETYDLSPYLGFGYRTLYNDARGTTDLGAKGYRRHNELYYLPFGIHPRTHLDSFSRLTATIEFDYVLHGLQKSD